MKISTIFLLMLAILALLFIWSYFRTEKGEKIKEKERLFFDARQLYQDHQIDLDEFKKIAFDYYRAMGIKESFLEKQFKSDLE